MYLPSVHGIISLVMVPWCCFICTRIFSEDMFMIKYCILLNRLHVRFQFCNNFLKLLLCHSSFPSSAVFLLILSIYFVICGKFLYSLSHMFDLFCVSYKCCSNRCSGLMVSALVPGSSGQGLSPGQEHCVVFLSKTLYSHSASLHPGV